MARTRTIMLIRHAEKPAIIDGEKHVGIRSRGSEDDDSLIVRGWQRAGALCPLFGVAATAAGRGLAVPAHLFASDPEKPNDKGSKSRRSKQTLVPLAKLLGIRINLEHARGEEAAVARAILTAGDSVLVAWPHEKLPDIARRIPGGDVAGTREWPDDRYDVVWVFDLQADGDYMFRRVAQALLAGDEPADRA